MRTLLLRKIIRPWQKALEHKIHQAEALLPIDTSQAAT
jgi:hypothetical protein